MHRWISCALARSVLQSSTGSGAADAENGDLDGDGDADCLACPPGSFHDASGARSECERCPRGHVTLQSASAGAHDCVACDVGSYAADTVN